jgi:hypothetical protein
MDTNNDKQTRKPYRPLIRTQEELQRAWHHLMEPLGFATRSLWLMLIDDDDRPIPHLTELTDLSSLPDARSARDLSGLVRKLGEALPHTRVAFLLSRPDTDPGPPDSPDSPCAPDASDRAWASLVYDAARDAGMPCEVVHLATDDSVIAVPCDSLAGNGPGSRSA